MFWKLIIIIIIINSCFQWFLQVIFGNNLILHQTQWTNDTWQTLKCNFLGISGRGVIIAFFCFKLPQLWEISLFIRKMNEPVMVNHEGKAFPKWFIPIELWISWQLFWKVSFIKNNLYFGHFITVTTGADPGFHRSILGNAISDVLRPSHGVLRSRFFKPKCHSY